MPPPISNVTHLSVSPIPSGTDRQQGVTVPAKPADVTLSGSQSTVSASDSQSTAAASCNQCTVSAVGSQSTVPVSDSLSTVVPTNGGDQSSSESADNRVVLKTILKRLHMVKERAPVVIVSSNNIECIMVVLSQYNLIMVHLTV